MLEHRDKSARDVITAPRLHAYVSFGRGHDGAIVTPEQARNWVREIAAAGADGIKFFGARPDVLEAAIVEAGKVGIGTTMHLAQLHVTRTHMLDAARMGLDSMEHWYGLPESMFADRTVQDYPHDYNYSDEQDRFAEAGKLWRQAVGPDSPRWHQVRDELIEMDFTIVPTLNIYQANRDLMRERTAEWHPLYTKPALWDFFEPSRTAHDSYWFDWTTAIEVDWKDNFRVHSLKVLYGTGAIKVDADNNIYRAGGVRYTIKNGIVFDAEKIRAGLREEVRRAWEEQGRVLTQPGMAKIQRLPTLTDRKKEEFPRAPDGR